MTYALFIDDERDPPSDGKAWRIARDIKQVDRILSEYGPPDYISFDHDLGEQEPTGHDIVKAMIEGDMGERPQTGFSVGLHPELIFYVHSQNPVGKANIEGLLTSYLSHRRRALEEHVYTEKGQDGTRKSRITRMVEETGLNLTRARTIAARQSAVTREVNKQASEDIGAAMDEWLADGRVAIPMRAAYPELEGIQETTPDIFPLFVALRPSRSGVIAVPVEIALAGVSSENEILLWHTEIAPPDHWQHHVAHDDLRVPTAALAARDVAQQVIFRRNRTRSGALYAQRDGLPKAMLDTLMEEHPCGDTDVSVQPLGNIGPTNIHSDKLRECIAFFLNGRVPDNDPVAEVISLASMWTFATKRYG